MGRPGAVLNDLAEFLRARLTEDEATAKDAAMAAGPDWLYDVGCCDPARMLREVEAKRRIMERHHANEDGMCEGCPTSEITLDPQVEISECPELRDLAAVYSDHPDYRQEWAS